MAYLTSVHIDTVVVVESLDKDRDEPTGVNLFETTIAPAADAHGMVAELYQAPTPSAFLGALQATLNIAESGHYPLLQIEAHGDEAGIETASGEVLDWSDLVPILTRINLASRMNLFVVAATCHGWHLTSVLRPSDRSPVWGVLGPPTGMSAQKLYDAMKVFFANLLSGYDAGTAVRRMNGDVTMDQWAFLITTAELHYCDIFRAYMRDVASETEPERVNRLVAEIARVRGLDISETMRIRTLDQGSRTWIEWHRERSRTFGSRPIAEQARDPLG